MCATRTPDTQPGPISKHTSFYLYIHTEKTKSINQHPVRTYCQDPDSCGWPFANPYKHKTKNMTTVHTTPQNHRLPNPEKRKRSNQKKPTEQNWVSSVNLNSLQLDTSTRTTSTASYRARSAQNNSKIICQTRWEYKIRHIQNPDSRKQVATGIMY